MNEHTLCCGTVADKAKLCAEIEKRDMRIKALEIAEEARARVSGRTLKFAMERGYNPANDENELEYIMRRFDEMAESDKEQQSVIRAQQRRIGELMQERDEALSKQVICASGCKEREALYEALAYAERLRAGLIECSAILDGAAHGRIGILAATCKINSIAELLVSETPEAALSAIKAKLQAEAFNESAEICESMIGSYTEDMVADALDCAAYEIRQRTQEPK